jgi:hypothetical protein
VERQGDSPDAGIEKKKADEADEGFAVPVIQFRAARDQRFQPFRRGLKITIAR